MLFYALFLIFWYKSHKCHDYSVSLSDSGCNIRDAVHISLYYYSLLMCHYVACILLFTRFFVVLRFCLFAPFELLTNNECSSMNAVNSSQWPRHDSRVKKHDGKLVTDAKKMTVNSSQKIPCDELTVWRVDWLPHRSVAENYLRRVINARRLL